MLKQGIKLAFQSPQIHTLPTNDRCYASKDQNNQSDVEKIEESKASKWWYHLAI